MHSKPGLHYSKTFNNCEGQLSGKRRKRTYPARTLNCRDPTEDIYTLNLCHRLTEL